MKIGFDSKRLFNNFSGLGNYSRSILKNLAEFYPDLVYHLYASKVKKDVETDYFLNNQAYNTYTSNAALKSYWRSYGIVDQLKKDQIEIFHGLSHEIPINLHKSTIKSVVSIHDVIFKVYPDTYTAFDRKMYDFKWSYSCKNADKIIAISESTKRDIIKYYDVDAARIQVIYQSCSPLFYEKRTSSEVSDVVLEKYNIPSEYLLSVGSIVERKNLGLIVEAYAKLRTNFKIPLVIVGKGKKHKEKILKQIKTVGIEKHIIWIDFLDDNHHLKVLYENAEILIYPSFYEGFGLPVVEALLCETPVITSSVSSLPEAGGPNSYYVNPHNADELTVAIEKVLGDRLVRKEMKQKGYEYAVTNFSPAVVTKQLMDLYAKIVKE